MSSAAAGWPEGPKALVQSEEYAIAAHGRSHPHKVWCAAHGGQAEHGKRLVKLHVCQQRIERESRRAIVVMLCVAYQGRVCDMGGIGGDFPIDMSHARPTAWPPAQNTEHRSRPARNRLHLKEPRGGELPSGGNGKPARHLEQFPLQVARLDPVRSGIDKRTMLHADHRVRNDAPVLKRIDLLIFPGRAVKRISPG